MSPNHTTPEAAAAAALAHLLAAQPELSVITWTVGEQPGVLVGRQTSESGAGEIIDTCAAVLDGTVVRSALGHGKGDRQGLAQLVAVYDGVLVEVSASYPLPGPDGLTSAELREVLSGRPLGTLAIVPGGAL